MAINPANSPSFEFEDFRLNPVERVLMRDGELVPLTPKVFDLLLLLVENHGHVLEKDRLMHEVWPDTFVEEGNLTQNISVLRKALGEKQYIQTIPRRGYRFVGNIKLLPANDEALLVEERIHSRIVVHETDDASLNGRVLPAVVLARQRTFVVAAAGLCVIIAAGIAWSLLRKTSASPSVAPRAPIRSIAVLPFKPLSSEGREEYLELGIADSLITRLSNVKQIIVRPTSSVRKFAGTTYDPIVAGRELKTDAVIDGSIQRLGDRLRINVQLIRVSDGSVLWGYHCDDLCTDLFSAQDSIAENVAHSLALTLSDVEDEALAKRYTSNPEALRAFLNARYYYGKRTRDSATRTVEYLEKAVELDPKYALAYAALSEAYASLSFLHVTTAKESMPKAKAAADRALELDPSLAQAHSAAGFIKLTYEWDWDGADREFKKALELNPNESVVHDDYATLLEALGRTDEAIAEDDKARELDPLSLLVSRNDGRAYYYARRYDRAIQIWQETAEMDPTFPAVNNWLTWAYELDGKYDQAIDTYLKQETLRGMTPEEQLSTRRLYESAGWTRFWQQMLEIHEPQFSSPSTDAYEVMQLYRRLGRNDEAFAWLNKACDERAVWVLWLRVDPALDNLRADPRFAKLMKRVGL
jgi:DNA-binding winged helix-turn-helix (wHTH) protein/TolB-like protein/Tfp pilus assembly protein PilF